MITMNSFSGLAGHLSHAQIDIQLALFVSGLAVVGALLGSFCSTKVRPDLLKRVFGGFVLVMAILIVYSEI